MSTNHVALIIGNSDGIGLALTRRLLHLGWTVAGISRRENNIDHPNYSHAVADVLSEEFTNVLSHHAQTPPNICVYCAGIGEELDFDNLAFERQVFGVNLTGAVRTIEIVLPALLRAQSGHVLMLSSTADVLVSPEAPSYCASKVALSSYVEGLALAMRGTGVAMTNVRFGFVDTKMAKGDRKPLMMTAERAVDHLMRCIDKRPVRYTRPRTMGLLAGLAQPMAKLQLALHRQ
ncbi:MAG: SDR family NAD(P)-dependent oxidoreductase [candidate division Zixibacteria bacterium]|nr:SDR family NAD(P)-dependent oxidoreductase [candidate division Zixibacteria bacterium]